MHINMSLIQTRTCHIIFEFFGTMLVLDGADNVKNSVAHHFRVTFVTHLRGVFLIFRVLSLKQ